MSILCWKFNSSLKSQHYKTSLRKLLTNNNVDYKFTFSWKLMYIWHRDHFSNHTRPIGRSSFYSNLTIWLSHEYWSQMKQSETFDRVGFGNIHTNTVNVAYLSACNNFSCATTVMMSLLYLIWFDDILFSNIHSYLQLASLKLGRFS